MSDLDRKQGVVVVTSAKGIHPVETAIFFKTHNADVVQSIMKTWGYEAEQFAIVLGSDFEGEVDHDILRPEHMVGV